MRLRLTLSRVEASSTIPLNYAYYLSSAIYRWIEQSSPEYSAFLHESGFSVEGTRRRFKHFCFSQLIVPRRTILDGRMRIESSTIEWFIGMPVETTLQHLVIGMFEKREFFIEREENRFVIEQVETLPEPKWERTMKFRMLSPLTISIPRENGTFRSDGRPKLTAEYLVPDDPRLNEALRSNIVNKFSSLFGTPPSDTEFICTPDSKFLADQERKGKRVTRLVIIKQGRSDESQIRGFMCPLTIEGNPALIALAYESGLGEKNSLGFGMLEVEARQPSTLHEHR